MTEDEAIDRSLNLEERIAAARERIAHGTKPVGVPSRTDITVHEGADFNGSRPRRRKGR